jgi:acetyl-CoA C-acetyltransferase
MEAYRNACFGVASGMYDLVLALGFEKLKDFGMNILPQGGSGINPVFGYGFSSAGEAALLAVRYFHKYGIGRETSAKIAVKNHHNGMLTPKAQLHREITVEEALNAPIIAWPLGLYDCCPRTDGAAAAILTRADMAKNFRDDYVLVKGMGVASNPGTNRVTQDYDFVHFEEIFRAARQAYEQVGIKEPFRELSLAELHDAFIIGELIEYEDLGLCPRGGAKEYIDAGAFTLEGEMPVNSDGGLKCFGHPQGATGLRMIYEAYTQLQGKAGARQLKNPKLGLCVNGGGLITQGAAATLTIVGR